VSAIEPTRRDFLAGFAAALALMFAPWERFFGGLRRLLIAVYEAPGSLVDEFSAILKSIWPQQKVYELAYANNPMFGLVRKNA
jgi:hypothetical protein